MFEVTTNLGEIRLSQNVIKKIVIGAVEKCGGRIEITNFKGKYMNNMTEIAAMMNLFDGESDGVRIIELEDGFEIQVSVIIHFGTSIKKITGRIIDYIYDEFEKMMEIKPKKVTIIVTGIISKNTVKRHIEVSR